MASIVPFQRWEERGGGQEGRIVTVTATVGSLGDHSQTRRMLLLSACVSVCVYNYLSVSG